MNLRSILLTIGILYAFHTVSAQITCASGNALIHEYTSYGISSTDNGEVNNPERALGFPNDDHAELNADNDFAKRGSMLVEFNNIVPQGDTVFFIVASKEDRVSTYRIGGSFNGSTLGNYVNRATTAPHKTFREVFYVVSNPSGIQYLSIASTSSDAKLFVESVSYKQKTCVSNCSDVSISYTQGYATNFHGSSTANNEDDGIGAPDFKGAELNGNDNDFLILNLNRVVPYGTKIQVYIADDGDPTQIRISGSTNNSTYDGLQIVTTRQKKEIYTPDIYTVNQVGGIRYIRFDVTQDGLKGFVDAVSYQFPNLYGKNNVSGIVFNDANRNGSINFGESVLSGVEAILYVDVNKDKVLDVEDVVIGTTNTNGSGKYSFDLTDAKGSYIVTINEDDLPNLTSLSTLPEISFSFSDLNLSECLDFGYYNCGGNCPPRLFDDNVTIDQNVTETVSVLSNDRGSIDTSSLSITGVRKPANGVISIVGNGQISYDPNPNYTGIDTFEYIICNESGLICDTATVAMTVVCPSVLGQNTIYGSTFSDLNVNEFFDAGEEWSAESFTINLHQDVNGDGVIDVSDIIVQTTTTNAQGIYQFNVPTGTSDYIVAIDISGGAIGTAITTGLTVPISFNGSNESVCGSDFGITNCAPFCNPILRDDIAFAGAGTALFLDVLANDVDYDNNLNLNSLYINQQPKYGNIVIGDDGLVIYVSNASFIGIDTFSYKICDGSWPTALCDSAMVYVSITPSYNDPCSEATREHTYFLPYPENELRDALINSSGNAPGQGGCGASHGNIARSITTIKSPYPGVVITYDHWEDGYESDIKNPLQSTTLVWGDGDLDNGTAPGYFDDIIPAGGNIVLDNTIVYNPRNPAVIAFDGKDKIHTDRDVAISKIAGDISIIGVQAAKTDVYDVNRFGTSFTIPFGEDLSNTEFQYTATFIRASENNTEVNVDLDNDGTIDTSTVLQEGEVFFVDGGILSGALVNSTRPVGVDLFFGGFDCFGTRQINILPGSFYANTYYTPVPTTLGSAPAAVYLYNSLPTNMTINWASLYNTGSFVIPARSDYRYVLTDNSGYKFVNAEGSAFTAIEVVDSDNSGSAYDWAFNLISAERLTEFASLAWGPGSVTGTANYNPVWVTPIADATIYIKYDGDISTPTNQTSPCGIPYDVAVPLTELAYYKVFDNSDNDQSGLAIYTCDGTPIAAVYGEDPSAGGPTPAASPAFDVGTSIQPMCLNQIIIATDDRGTVLPGDSIVLDVTANDFAFLTTLDATTVSNVGLLAPSNGTINIHDDGTITYTPNPGWSGIDTFEYNVCSVEYPSLCDVATVYVDITLCSATPNENLVNGFVYLEQITDNGTYDAEDRISSVSVLLYGDLDCDGIIDNNERIIDLTQSDASGAFSFSTLNVIFVEDDFQDDGSLDNGNDGSLEWDNSWQEINTVDGFLSHPVLISNDPLPGAGRSLVLSGASKGAFRSVTFDGATEATLKFKYRRKDLENSGEALTVQFNGYTQTVIDDGNGIGSNPFYTEVEINIPYAQILPNGSNDIQFITSVNTDNTDYFYIDDVQVSFNSGEVCYITKVNTDLNYGAYIPALLNQDSASFLAALGNCENDKYLGVLANIVASDDASSGEVDNIQTIAVLSNDIGNFDNASISNTGVLSPSDGSLIFNLNGSIDYTPNPGFVGNDQFEYIVCSSDDGQVCDTALVDILVSCAFTVDSNIIAGSIFNDRNNTATFDVGETLFPNVGVNLYIDDNANGQLDNNEGNTVVASQVVTNGNYKFTQEAPLDLSPIQTFHTPITSIFGDGREKSNGDAFVTENDIKIKSSEPYAGLVFQNINIPQGAIITSASLTFNASGNGDKVTNWIFSIEENDNAPLLNDDDYHISNRWSGATTVNWNNVPEWVDKTKYTSPNIASLIQSIVDRGGWNSGNRMAILIQSTGEERKFTSYDDDPALAADLEINYQVLTNNYPISYIVTLDTNNLAPGIQITTDNIETALFANEGESACSRNFGVMRNSIFVVEDVNVTLQYMPVSGSVKTNDFDLEYSTLQFNTFLAQGSDDQNTLSGDMIGGNYKFSNEIVNAGRLYFDASGKYTFIPDSNFIGEASLQYVMCLADNSTACDTAELTIIVEPFTNPNTTDYNSVTAVDDYVVSYGNAITGNLLSNDADPDDNQIRIDKFFSNNTGGRSIKMNRNFTVSGVTEFGQNTNNAGDITIYNNGSYVFEPNNNFKGIVQLEYKIKDNLSEGIGNGGVMDAEDFGILTIRVVAASTAIDNSPPFAGDDYISTMMNIPVTGSWMSNDRDNNGDNMVLNNTETELNPNTPAFGSVVTSSLTKFGGIVDFKDDGTYYYQPPFGFFGPDRVTYKLCDVNANGSLCDSATVYFLVTPVGCDHGDLGGKYPEAGHLISYDFNNDGELELEKSFWLGQYIDAEIQGMSSEDAAGDDNDAFNDEQSLVLPATYISGENVVFNIQVSSSNPGTEVFVGLWIDWDEDGIFDDFYEDDVVTSEIQYDGERRRPNDQRATSTNLISFSVAVPILNDFPSPGIRLRAFSSSPDEEDFTGTFRGGEVEDYVWSGFGALLPVELTKFDVTTVDGDASIVWQTESELNNDYFEIQKSDNAIDWENIGMVEGNGTSTTIHNYSFVDESIETNKVIYYRLKQFDFDGSFEFSSIKFVNIEQTNPEAISFKVYPNPTQGMVNLEIVGAQETDEKFSVNVYSVSGALVYATQSLLYANSTQFDMSHLPSGNYVVAIQSSTQKITSILIEKN